MSFWNSNKVKSQGRQIFGDFYKENSVKCGAYEMRIRSMALVSGSDVEGDGRCIKIKPGQFAILMTHEKVSIPEATLGLISIKYSHKKKGLVNISGFHVDPGFSGHLKFSVFNASPRTLFIDPLQPFFQIWFCDMRGECSSYVGVHGDQDRFTADEHELVDSEFLSPPVLMKEMSELRKEVSNWKKVTYGIGIAVVIALLKSVIIPG